MACSEGSFKVKIKFMRGKITAQERLFIEAYTGDDAKAAQAAGYQGEPTFLKRTGEALRRRPEIILAIKERDTYSKEQQKIIADRKERQSFWTSIMRNKDPYNDTPEKDEFGIDKPIPLQTRLKASEMLGKSEADFTDKIDVSGNVTITDLVQQSFMIEDDIDAIEVEYERLREEKQIALSKNNEEEIEDVESTPVEAKPSLSSFL